MRAAEQRLRRVSWQRLPPRKRRVLQPCDLLQLLACEIGRFTRIRLHIVKLSVASVGVDQQFPFTPAHRDVRAAMLRVGRAAEGVRIATILEEERSVSRRRFTEQRRAHIFAIETCSARRLRVGDGAEGRKKIERRNDGLRVDTSWWNVTRPAHDQRYANAALIEA